MSNENKQHDLNQYFLDYMMSHKWSTLFFIVFGMFWAFTLPYMAYLFGEIINQIKLHGLESVPTYKLVLVPLSLYIIIHVLRSVGYFGNGLFSLVSTTTYKANITHRLFAHLSKQSMRYFEEKRAGYITNKITNLNIALEPIIYNFFMSIYPQSLAIIITGIMLSSVVPYFGLVLWVWGVAIIIYTFKSAKIARKNSVDFAHTCNVFNGYLVDVFTNIQSVIYHGAFKQESKLLDENTQMLVDKERIRNRYANRVMFVQHLAMNAIVAFYLVGSIIGYYKHMVSLGEVVFVMTSVTAIAGLTSSLGNCFLEFMYHVGSVREGLDLLQDVPDVPEHASAKAHVIQRGAIKLENITFSYPKASPVFKAFSLDIPSKHKLGIVGSSGAGKSTLIKLLMRLYDLDEGCIEIDGLNLTEYKKESLRHQIAIVPQHLNLFHRSILDNIAYGVVNPSKQRVIEAAKKAECHDFIMKLESGYDTMIGEQGVKLSGGQRQRIAIARAIFKNAPIILLDEATSALDSATEESIQKALQTLLQDKTAIVVAHRLSTLKTMDEIIVLEHGQLVERGTHDALLIANGAYKTYWSYQTNGFIAG